MAVSFVDGSSFQEGRRLIGQCLEVSSKSNSCSIHEFVGRATPPVLDAAGDIAKNGHELSGVVSPGSFHTGWHLS